MVSEGGCWGVLLLAHGAPERLEEIPQFLLNVRSGRELPEEIVRAVTERYARIGGGSPLLEITNRQARALEQRLNRPQDEAPGKIGRSRFFVPVAVGMRNWKPFIPEAVRKLADMGVRKTITICLAPHSSSTSVGLYRRFLDAAISAVTPRMEADFVESWHDHPGLIAAFAEKLARSLSTADPGPRKTVPVIFTAHSVPQRSIADGDPYETQVRETARLVAESLHLENWRIAFQSQGMTKEAWIGPTLESEVDRLAQDGACRVLIAPVGFVSDHLEILYDIDVAIREYGKKKGVEIARTESLNDSPLFIRALASLVAAHIHVPASELPARG
jgi:protoporphyrin/coproporphyrin ferrochelatase